MRLELTKISFILALAWATTACTPRAMDLQLSLLTTANTIIPVITAGPLETQSVETAPGFYTLNLSLFNLTTVQFQGGVSPYFIELGSNCGASSDMTVTPTTTGLSASATAADSCTVDVYDSLNRKLTLVVSQINYQVLTLAGSALMAGSTDGIGGTARFNGVSGIAVDSSKNVYVADTGNNTIRKIDSAGATTTFAGNASLPAGQVDGAANTATFNGPMGVAMDSSGNVYVADTGNNAIRKITPGTPYGTVSTLAGAGSGSTGNADGNGILATFDQPRGIVVDGSGYLYVTEIGAGNTYGRVRKISPTGVVTTLAVSASLATGVHGIAIDGSGNLFITDGLPAYLILKVTPGGVVTTVTNVNTLAGNDGYINGMTPQFPGGSTNIAVDANGNIYIDDNNYNIVWKILSDGSVGAIIANTPYRVGSTDGDGTVAKFNGPMGIAVDSFGTLYVADTGNDTIRTLR